MMSFSLPLLLLWNLLVIKLLAIAQCYYNFNLFCFGGESTTTALSGLMLALRIHQALQGSEIPEVQLAA